MKRSRSQGSLLLFLLGFLSLGYAHAQLPPEIEIADFNQDGFIDTITTKKDLYEFEVTLKEGKSGKTYTKSPIREKWDFFKLLPIEKELNLPQNEGLRKALEAKAMYAQEKPHAEGSLKWLISVYLADARELEGDFFRSVCKFSPEWHAGPMEFPGNYRVQVGLDTVKALMRRIGNEFEVVEPDSMGGAWLIYYGNFHDNPNYMLGRETGNGSATDYKREGIRLLTTSHGVAIEQGGRHKWIFVNDARYTHGVEKMRFNSIQKAVMADGLVIILTSGEGFGEYLFMVDPEAGLFAEFMGWPVEIGNYDDKPPTQIEIIEGNLIVSYGNDKNTLNMAALKRKLHEIYDGQEKNKLFYH